jgi:hypothetical protein
MAGSGRGVFVSYSHTDTKWLERPHVYLKELEKRGVAVGWTDHQIQPGGHWRDEILQAIDEAAVAVLLISQDFLASDFIQDVELPKILDAGTDRRLGASIDRDGRAAEDARLTWSEFSAYGHAAQHAQEARSEVGLRMWRD